MIPNLLIKIHLFILFGGLAGATPVAIDAISAALEEAKAPDEVLAIEKQLDLAEQYMNASGLYTADQIRNVNELRMRARWKLGQLLARVERGAGLGGERWAQTAHLLSRTSKS